jgi:hypothetical protein
MQRYHPTFEINQVEIAYYEHATTRISPYDPFAKAGKQAIQDASPGRNIRNGMI